MSGQLQRPEEQAQEQQQQAGRAGAGQWCPQRGGTGPLILSSDPLVRRGLRPEQAGPRGASPRHAEVHPDGEAWGPWAT